MKRYQQLENYEFTNHLSENKHNKSLNRIFFYNFQKHQYPIYNNNHFQVLTTPLEHIQEQINLIKNAKKFIHFEYYIFCDGRVLDYLLDLLQEKIKQGVKVRCLLDDWGNYWKLTKKTRKRIKSIGIDIRFFNPLFGRGSTWWQFRNHNKLIIVDNEAVMYGSCNISDEYYNITSYFFQTTEISLILKGNIVNSFNALFLTHWKMSQPKNSVNVDPPLEETINCDQLEDNSPNSVMQLVNSAPLMNEQIIKNNLIQLIYGAKKSITISTPYFCPPKDLCDALILASLSGVKVTLLVPKQVDFSNFFLTVNRHLFKELLNANILIYEYFGFNHEKLTIIDDDIVYLGSYNLDYRALYLNFESVLLIHSSHLAQELKSFMEQQYKNTHLITKEDLSFAPKISNIFVSAFIGLFKPFL